MIKDFPDLMRRTKKRAVSVLRRRSPADDISANVQEIQEQLVRVSLITRPRTSRGVMVESSELNVPPSSPSRPLITRHVKKAVKNIVSAVDKRLPTDFMAVWLFSTAAGVWYYQNEIAQVCYRNYSTENFVRNIVPLLSSVRNKQCSNKRLEVADSLSKLKLAFALGAGVLSKQIVVSLKDSISRSGISDAQFSAITGLNISNRPTPQATGASEAGPSIRRPRQ
jgi:hypothetical protein